MSRRASIAALLLTVGVTAAGCAAIPGSSPVAVVGQPSDDQTLEVKPPSDELDPQQVVRGFLEASASQVNKHAAARTYLADEVKDSWNDAGPVVVIDDTPGTPNRQEPGDTQTEEYRQIRLLGQQLGTLGTDGSFTPSRTALDLVVGVVKQGGRWRISEPPPVLLVELRYFRTSYKPISLRFVDPVRGVLVTDQRRIPYQPSANWPSRAIDLLLGGPSVGLRDAVVNELAGATTRTNVVPTDTDVLTVDLSGVPDLSDNQRRLAVAQIVGSLREVVAPQVQIRIQNDGAPLVASQLTWHTDDSRAFTPDDSVKPDLPPLAVNAGRLYNTSGDPVAGPAGDGAVTVESAAQSASGDLLAVVARGGAGAQLLLGPNASPQSAGLQAATMTRPTWRRGNRGEESRASGSSEVWTVLNGKEGAAVVRSDSGELRSFTIDLSELSTKGRITELRISRDGLRAAAIVDGALYVAIVVGSDTETKVRNPRLLVGPGAPQLVDVDWRGPEALIVASRSKEVPLVYDVSLDGLTWTPFSTVNLTGPLTGIATTASRLILVADATGLWSAADSNQLWASVGFGPGVDPLYPG